MNVYQLGHVPWELSQLIYHALPRLNLEGVILLSPASPYVCIGYHQNASQEVDLAYCLEHHIPVFRREVGGGAVYLDGRQLFYQIVLKRDHPLASGDKATFYERLLKPVVEAYGALGIPTRYKPINDIVTQAGRKISGNGAAHIEESVVLVGNLIFDFDYETMARVLKVPDEKYRDKVFKSLNENLTTIRRELGRDVDEAGASAILLERLSSVLGSLEPASLPAAVLQRADELGQRLLSESWLRGRERPLRDERDVKIAGGIHVIQRLRKTPGGLVRATLEIQDNVIRSASITGDFFFYPESKLVDLEERLVGVQLEQLDDVIAMFYRHQQIDSPGLMPMELASLLQGTL